MNNILITGITGQDGIFLTSKLLKQKNKIIFGLSRNKHSKYLIDSLKSLGVNDISNLKLIQNDLLDINSVESLILKIKPTTIYNFTGPSSVYNSLLDDGISKEQIIKIFDNLISASMKLKTLPIFFQASSSEMFGPGHNKLLNEESEFNPISPYAEAKLANHNKVLDFSKRYNWNIKSGIMFNHESEFRKDNYLFSKVIKSVIEINNGIRKTLTVGSLDYERDWTFAGDIVEAINLVVNDSKKSTYVIGSGYSNKIKDLIQITFEYFDLDWERYVKTDKSLLRKNDPISIVSDPTLIKSELNWKPKLTFQELIERCIISEVRAKNFKNK